MVDIYILLNFDTLEKKHVSIFRHLLWVDQDTRNGESYPLQRCNQCILQLQQTGLNY